jgi:hypothetical protein
VPNFGVGWAPPFVPAKLQPGNGAETEFVLKATMHFLQPFLLSVLLQQGTVVYRMWRGHVPALEHDQLHTAIYVYTKVHGTRAPTGTSQVRIMVFSLLHSQLL